jgi:DNA-binding GntR family transcriptional regulator
VQQANGTLSKLNHATLAQQVYEHLRERILANTYPPEVPLPEEALAAEFQVSRVPVREALRRLAAEGLVTLTPRQGAVVSSLSPKQFLDAYRVREALETLAIRLATPRITSDDLAELDRLQEEMRRQAATGNVAAFFAANAAFHLLLVDRADNADLTTIYAGLLDRLRRYRTPSLDLRGGLARSIDEHQAILDAVRAGDAEAAARLLAEHIEVPQRALEEASW